MGDRSLPSLPTSTAGSYARPSWLVAGLEAAGRGEFGPADLREMLDDAVDMALHDQAEAGIDLLTDGEMRRAGFFTAEFYRHLTGLRGVEPERRLGAIGHDRLHRFEVLEPISAPNGLGVVDEFAYARTRTERPLKVTIPGPFTLSGRLRTGAVYPDRIAAAWAFVPIIKAEVHALESAGARWIQVDEPSPAIHPEAPVDFAELFNAATAGLGPDVRVAAHLCFGNYMGRPLAKRTYRPVLEQVLRFKVAELVLEEANREMAELDLLAEISAAGRDLAIGVVDVKSSYVETAEDVAERVDLLLGAGVPLDRLALVPDCGFSQTPREIARGKLRALVAGRDLLLGRPA